MYNLTVFAFRSNLNNKAAIITEMMAHMNLLWQKFSWETTSLKLDMQQKVEQFVSDIIQIQIDENLNMISKDSNNAFDEQSDASEDFDKSQRT